ncbi:MAG: TetR/AcrR family transcriptional regulator [Clostridia bacterium]|nr:TetR/AcrR family transcriptional regulator [Clostridia bacterium]
MPPKAKITKENILSAALDIVRQEGVDALNARTLAGKLACSTQPIFSNYPNMKTLKSDVIACANELYQQYLSNDMASGKYPPYKASGMAYIRFAREEKELFKLLFMRDRTEEEKSGTQELEPILAIIRNNYGLTREKAELFHIGMWVYVHGIATMIATSYLDWDTDLTSIMTSMAFNAMIKEFTSEEQNECN